MSKLGELTERLSAQIKVLNGAVWFSPFIKMWSNNFASFYIHYLPFRLYQGSKLSVLNFSMVSTFRNTLNGS